MLSKNRLPVQAGSYYPPEDNSTNHVPSRKRCLKKNLMIIKNANGWFNLVKLGSEEFKSYNLGEVK